MLSVVAFVHLILAPVKLDIVTEFAMTPLFSFYFLTFFDCSFTPTPHLFGKLELDNEFKNMNGKRLHFFIFIA